MNMKIHRDVSGELVSPTLLATAVDQSATDLVTDINTKIGATSLNGKVQAALNATGDGIDFRTVEAGQRITLAGTALAGSYITPPPPC